MDDRVEAKAGSAPINPWGEAGPQTPTREPFLKLPWPPAAIAITLIAIYALEATLADPNAIAAQFGFIPALFMRGGWYGLFTAIFVHGSWAHVLINAAFCVAFGAPVARRFGLGALGGSLFLLFFVICGVCGNFGYALIHPQGFDAVVGASGAIAGFYAAMSRMLRGPKLLPMNSTPVLVMGAAWIGINLFVGLFKLDAGFGATGTPVAWEAHIAGYIAGLLLVGFFVRAAPGPGFRRRKD